jgi:hypothetical protein
MLIRPLATLLVLVLAACTAPGADPTATDRSTPSPSPELETVEPSGDESPRPGEMTITGHLGFEDIEGGCPYLQADDGTRYQVMWPDGWHLDGQGRLIDPSGETVARGNDEVTVRGQVAEDMASICQIGPIFRAREVVVD